MHILFIEPDKKLAAIYSEALAKHDHEVVTVAHAQDAVHMADLQRPDLIILELQLTAHNGIEFLYEIRSYPEWESIPVVLLTLVDPVSLNITSEMMERLGIARCFYKPATSLKQLVEAVEDLA